MTPSGSIEPAIPRPNRAQPTTRSGSEPNPTARSPNPRVAATAVSTGRRPIRSATQPTGSSTIRSTSCASESRPEMPARSSPNSLVPRSGITNWLTADQASAMTTPSANMRRTIGGTATARAGALSVASRAAAGGADGRWRRNLRISTSVPASDSSTGPAAGSRGTVHGQRSRSRPTTVSPRSGPNAPTHTVLAKTTRHRSTVPDSEDALTPEGGSGLEAPLGPPGIERRHVLAGPLGEARRALLQERRHALVGVGRAARPVHAARVHAVRLHPAIGGPQYPHQPAREGPPERGG